MTTRTEQEQIELFATWWKENGTFLVVGVIVLLLSYFGWTTWQSQQQAQAAKASAIFQQIIDQQNGKASDKPAASIKELADQLKKDYTNTYYGQALHLLLAEDAVKNGDLVSAENELTALVAQKPKDTLAFTARLRLGRVLYAEGKYDAAIIQLAPDVPAAYRSLFAELRGDVLVAQKQVVRARESYTEALSALPKDSSEQKETLEMKLNSLPAQ